jgi:NAD(P)H-dependent flavin oxidoreductase YrpB (nitropropane dioxygenase family)
MKKPDGLRKINWEELNMTYQEVLEQARACIGPYCKACPVCNGLACKNAIPGPGAKGMGTGFIRNYQKWQELCVNMDTICENAPADTTFSLFGREFALPVFASPVGAMTLHYGDKYNDLQYNDILVAGCAQAGIAAFTGDGTNPAVMEGAVAAIAKNNGFGVPTVKPWNMETVQEKMELVRSAQPLAVAMDIDAAGLPFLKNMTPPAGSKTVAQLKQIAAWAGKPFILKGIMTVAGAKKALEAGASGIVVSNHGGRVLDQCPATAEVLPEIADAVGGRMTIFVDGGIRTGMDVFKALALGADAVLIARPFVTMVYGAGAEGIRVYTDRLKAELSDTMAMCGAHSLSDICRSMVYSK